LDKIRVPFNRKERKVLRRVRKDIDSNLKLILFLNLKKNVNIRVVFIRDILVPINRTDRKVLLKVRKCLFGSNFFQVLKSVKIRVAGIRVICVPF